MKFGCNIKNSIRKILMYIFAHTRISKSKSIFFISFSGKQYSDSPRVISERIHNIDPSIRLIWLGNTDVKNIAPGYVDVVNVSTIKALKEMARANAWVANTSLSSGTYKHKRVFYVQTFHGDRGFKKCGYDAAKSMGDSYRKSTVRFVENKICDVYMVGSKYGIDLAENAFDYHGKFSTYGIPRNDLLINADLQIDRMKTAKSKLNIAPNTKIMLYAPTFRDDNRESQVANIDLVNCLDILSRNGEKWICLMRAHSATKKLYSTYTDSRIIDASKYEDMVDLLLISDLLITDYSSSAPDYVLTNRPVVLAQFDIEDYIKNSRTLSVNPEESGFLIAHNQIQLNDILENIYNYDHKDIRKIVDKFYGAFETGESAIMICDEILSWIKGE